MKTITKTILYLQVTALCLTAALAGPAAAEKEVPLRGTMQTSVTRSSFEFPILSRSVIGTGNATHLGQFTVTWEVEIDITLPVSVAVGSAVFTAANGDTLFTTLEGIGYPTDDPDVVSIVEVQTITGGTGRFAGATGSFIREALSHRSTGLTSGSFEGTISY